ncbi:MAG: hypothetical protein PHD10_03620 [Bacilli bacterium]|nr:hypothetical protein [Bacilli bacterium]MDD4608199.1 hypothetical protein [Bacilli bacterium]
MRKGFTLIELLGIIILIGIIGLIAVPAVTNLVQSSKERMYDNQVAMIKGAAKKWAVQNVNELSESKPVFLSIDKLIKEGTIQQNDVKDPRRGNQNMNGCVVIEFDKNYKSYQYQYIEDECTLLVSVGEYNENKKVNSPKIVTGLTPVKWEDGTWVETTENDPEWYDYDNKKWANARTKDGSMWVWIPRYVYNISSGWHQQDEAPIDIRFSIITDDTIGGTTTIVNTGKANDSNGTWTNHPAFTFGDKELTGIWYAKFEATAREDVESKTSWGCYNSDNSIDKHVKIIPNANSWRCIFIGNMFTVSRNMETDDAYGWGTSGEGIDTHLAKNIEWGAAAYLSQSKYGKMEEVWRNNSNIYMTGCAGTAVYGASFAGCQNTYETLDGQQASTTGNITGIYDMSGGSWEFVSGHLDNNHPVFTTWAKSIIDADPKYSDLYPVTVDSALTNYENSKNLKGDAVYETSSSKDGETSWYGDLAWPHEKDNAWYLRGGFWNDHGGDAGLFHFAQNDGDRYSYFGFRPVLVVGDGL